SLGVALVVSGLLIGVVAAPLEYGLGAVAFTFLAACSARVGGLFQQLRWVFLALGVAAFSLRFFLARRGGRRAAVGKVSYLIVFFLVVSPPLLLPPVSVDFTGLNLLALICIFYLSPRGAFHIVQTHAAYSARRLAVGLVAYSAPLLVLPIVGYFLRI